MASIFQHILDAILGTARDKAREVDYSYHVTGSKSRSTTLKIHNSIKSIMAGYTNSKIGKSVIPEDRLRNTDYRTYERMYVLYSTTSEAYIKHYESYFIDKFFDDLDNKHVHSTGKPTQIKQRFYLYIVVSG